MAVMPELSEQYLSEKSLLPARLKSPEDIGKTNAIYPIAKRFFDIVFTLSAILCALPLLALISLVLACIQGRPIFIKHYRVGRHGKSFPCFKFRTMVNNADEALTAHLASNPALRSEWEATRKLKKDPRVTAFGAVLRKSSVDEIPQLWNVVRGDMSLVGPRPIVDKEIKFYGSAIAKYYDVRPGLTGPWQISGRSDVTYATRVRLDEDYVDNGSFQRDLGILLKTVPAVMRMRGSY